MSEVSLVFKELETIRFFKVPLSTGISETSQPRLFSDLLVQHGLIHKTKASAINSIRAHSDYEKVSELISAVSTSIEIASNQERATKIFDELVGILYSDIELKDLAEQLVKHQRKEDPSYSNPLDSVVRATSGKEPPLNGKSKSRNSSGDSGNASNDSDLDSEINSLCKCPCGRTDFKHCLQSPPDCLSKGFPEVDLVNGDDSKKAQEYIEKKLSAETDFVKTEFVRFGMAVCNFVQSVPNKDTILKRMLKLRGHKVIHSESEDLYDRIIEGADFVNYEILSVVLEACSLAGVGNVKTELQLNAETTLEKYKEVFLKFAQQRVFMTRSQIQELDSTAVKETHKELIIKVEEEFREFLVERIFHFKIAVKSILMLPEHVFLRVVLVKEGCVEMTFQVIGLVQEPPLQLSLNQKRGLASHKISLLKYAGEVEYCCCDLFEDELAKNVVRGFYEVICQTDFAKDEINDEKESGHSESQDCYCQEQNSSCQTTKCTHCGTQTQSCSLECHLLECDKRDTDTSVVSDSSSIPSGDSKEQLSNKLNDQLSSTKSDSCYDTDKEPLEPVELSILSIYGNNSHKNIKVAEHIGQHVCRCTSLAQDSALGGKPRHCDNKLCVYFRWFYPYHYNQCQYACFQDSKQVSDCQSCNKLRAWVQIHSEGCTVKCPISLCQRVFKRNQLTKRLTDPHIKGLLLPHRQPSPVNQPLRLPNDYYYLHTGLERGSPVTNYPFRPTLYEQNRNDSNYGGHVMSSVNDVDQRESNLTATHHHYSHSQWEQAAENYSRSSREDFYSSTFSMSTADPFRSDLSDNLVHGPAEYEPVEKMNPAFRKNQSLTRFSFDSNRQSISHSAKELQLHSSTVVSSTDEAEESGRPTNHSSFFAIANSEAILPIVSQDRVHQRTLPIINQRPSSHKITSHQRVQRQNTHQDLKKKVVFPGNSGRNSMNLQLSTGEANILREKSNASHDSHVTSTEQSTEVSKSPRRSRILSEKRKQQLKSQNNVESPELVQKFNSASGTRSKRSGLKGQDIVYRTSSPEDDCSEGFSSLEESEPVFSDSDTHRVPLHPHGPGSAICSASSDSSPGPSSLEEANRTKPRHHIVQRVDMDPGDHHTKILIGNGSITPADIKHIHNFRYGLDVMLRNKKSSDLESNRCTTSGVSLASMSNSSINSARSSCMSGVFSELDFGSLEREQTGESSTGGVIYNYETEDSASTVVGTSASDQSLSSEYFHPSLTHARDDCGRQQSNNSSASHRLHSSLSPLGSHPPQESHTSIPYHDDSGLYDESCHLQSPFLSHPHKHGVPSSLGPSSYEEESTHHSSEESDSDEPPPEISPYAIAHSSDESDRESDDEMYKPFSSSFLTKTLQEVDRALVDHEQDIHIMRHQLKRRGRVPTHKKPGMSEEDKQQLQPQMYSVDHDSDYFPIPPIYKKPDQEVVEKEREVYEQMLSQRLPDTPEEDEIIWEGTMARRDHLKQYLVGQYYSDQVYREHTDWERKSKLGHGAQASCFSVCDRRTKCLLVMKEMKENKKTLDEAYISLKLACQSNPSPNIVEYYTAALLPGDLILPPQHSPYVQIFMEQMPACLKSLLLKSGPIPLHNVHHYACQLFEALDFLHNKQGIIHCDIKPGNILVDETAQRIKLADFGSAEILEKKKMSQSRFFVADSNAGILSYNPPEFYRERQCSFAFDIWQAGCCVLAMCTGRRPWRHLFMDVYPRKQPEQLGTIMKKRNMLLIGQQRYGHQHPAFLTPTLKKLLHGCLRDDPSERLSAKECSYMLNTETASTSEERDKIPQAIGFSPGRPTILRSFSTEQPRVDVYLGADAITKVPLSDPTHPRLGGGSVHLAMNGGWLGSIECPEGMTYRQAEAEIQRIFPVTKQLGPFLLASYDNNPHSIWTVCSGRDHVPPYRHIRPNSPVDLTSAIVLSPATMV